MSEQLPIRVGFVVHQMQVAGAEILVQRMIQQLRGRIEPTIICLDALGTLGQQLREHGIPVYVLDRKPGIDWSLPHQIAEIVNQSTLDLLHVHQYTPFFYTAISRFRRRWKARILFTEHGRPYPDVVSPKRYWTNRIWLQRLADLTTACCQWSADSLQKTDGFQDVIVIPNGVDANQFRSRGQNCDINCRRRDLGLEPNVPYVACVARFHPVKDHPTLIAAWRMVQSAIPESRLLLVGDGQERTAIEKQIQSLGLGSSIQLLGIRNDVDKILQSVNVNVLASVSEAASLTLLEAMACQCPCVVTDVGGNRELIRDGREGFVAPKSDSTALASRIIQLLSDDTLCRKFGESARRRVLADFDLNDIVERYAKHYQTLAGRNDPGTPLFPGLDHEQSVVSTFLAAKSQGS